VSFFSGLYVWLQVSAKRFSADGGDRTAIDDAILACMGSVGVRAIIICSILGMVCFQAARDHSDRSFIFHISWAFLF